MYSSLIPGTTIILDASPRVFVIGLSRRMAEVAVRIQPSRLDEKDVWPNDFR